MAELLITQGLPASGKSTWAKKLVDDGDGRWKRFNKDDFRSMIDNGRWSSKNEKFVLTVQKFAIEEALRRRYSVVVDDTNLSPKMYKRYQEIAAECDVDFKVKSFLHIPVEECIKRDKNRTTGYVGAGVINNMVKQFEEWYGKTLPICSTCGKESDIYPCLCSDSFHILMRAKCPKSCGCECHEPLLNALHEHYGKPCPGKYNVANLEGI